MKLDPAVPHGTSSKKPHKCPVCDGEGKREKQIDGIRAVFNCSTCTGTGVLWG